jgi:hypothetical protein
MSYIKLNRGGYAKLKMIKERPTAFLLLNLVADRAKRTTDHPNKDLEIGEALIGDYENYGVTRQIYRTDKRYLIANQQLTTRLTTHGTVAKLINSNIFDINEDTANHPSNTKLTTNKNDIKNDIYVETKKIATILLGHFNKVMGRNCTNVDSYLTNLSYWLTIYSKEQIAKAISRMPKHQFFSKLETPVTLFRRKNQNREDVDYIGQLLNSQPQKTITTFNDLIK